MTTAVSHNVFGLPGVGNLGARIMTIAQTIAEVDPDLVLLQEVYTGRVLQKFRDRLPKLPYAAFAPGRFGHPRNALVILSRKPVRDVRLMSFSTRWRDVGRGFGKGALWCKVDDVTVMNLHVMSNPLAIWALPHPRLAAQARQIDRLVGIINQTDGPLIVGGDSNLDRSSEVYGRLEVNTGLTNPFDNSPTLIGKDDLPWCVDCLLIRGWDDHKTEAMHLFTGQTARWTLARHWPRMDVVSDHEALCLKLVQA